MGRGNDGGGLPVGCVFCTVLCAKIAWRVFCSEEAQGKKKKLPHVALPPEGSLCVLQFRTKVRQRAAVDSEEVGSVNEGQEVTLLKTKILKKGNQRAKIQAGGMTGWINCAGSKSGKPALRMIREPPPTAALTRFRQERATGSAAPAHDMARDELGAYASLHAFLVANGLGAYEAGLQELGATVVSDLADLDEADMKGVTRPLCTLYAAHR